MLTKKFKMYQKDYSGGWYNDGDVEITNDVSWPSPIHRALLKVMEKQIANPFCCAVAVKDMETNEVMMRDFWERDKDYFDKDVKKDKERRATS